MLKTSNPSSCFLATRKTYELQTVSSMTSEMLVLEPSTLRALIIA